MIQKTHDKIELQMNVENKRKCISFVILVRSPYVRREFEHVFLIPRNLLHSFIFLDTGSIVRKVKLDEFIKELVG